MSLSGRNLAQLAEVCIRDAQAQLDPRHSPDYLESDPPPRAITPADVEEAKRLTILAERLEFFSMLAGFCEGDDPFESDAENERRRCDEWDRVLP